MHCITFEQDARSTVQTEQAMLFGIENIYPKAWGRAAGSGSGYGFKRNCKEPAFTEYEVKQNVTLLSDISAGQCMFRRYVFFTATIWMEQTVEAGISLYRKERTPAEIALQRVVKEPPVFSRKMLCHKKNLIIY